MLLFDSLIPDLLFLVLLLFLLRFLEGTAAMRGTKGEDSMPPVAKKVLRGVFLALVAAPLLLLLPFYVWLGLVLMYLPSYTDLSELRDGRPSRWIKSWPVWGWIRNYFPLDLVLAGTLSDQGKYIFAVHPHGILPFGGFTNLLTDCNGASEKFGKLQVRTLAASFCFYIPVYREILLGGGVCDASRYSASHILKSGKSLILVPGGATEALYTDPANDVAHLRNRKGFVKLAMTHGCQLVPVYSFNECNTYNQLSVDNKTVVWLKKKFQAIFGISLPLITNLLPNRVHITTVIGDPLSIPHIEDPTDEQVEDALNLYITELERFYNLHKDKYNTKTKVLKII